ncbi:MAG TPA: hypothetical protein VFV50_07465 [Bdellovibrionales bacterium]|nr:hypothetical protein [Bdellovibrionales bacterium]
MKRASILSIISLLILAAAVACGGKSNTSASSGGTSPTPVPTDPPQVDADAPVALQIYTTYHNQSAATYHEFTETGTTRCEATTTDPNVTCTIVVPEGRLYYSDLTFQFSWLTSECNIFFFSPYYYLHTALGVGVTINPPWTDYAATTCETLSTASPSCWGGAAPDLVDGFPRYDTLFYTPDESIAGGPQTDKVTLSSSYSRNFGSNRGACNDIPTGREVNTYTAAQLGTAGDRYEGNSFVHYQFYCRDHWYDPQSYTIDLIISEEDSESGAVNHVPSWKEVP